MLKYFVVVKWFAPVPTGIRVHKVIPGTSPITLPELTVRGSLSIQKPAWTSEVVLLI